MCDVQQNEMQNCERVIRVDGLFTDLTTPTSTGEADNGLGSDFGV
jgi:hypothetical protein